MVKYYIILHATENTHSEYSNNTEIMVSYK